MALNALDVLRVSVRFRLSSDQDHVNVYYVMANGAITDSDGDILAALADHYDTAYSACATNISNLCDPVDLKADVVEFSGGEMVVVRNLGTTPFTMTTAPSAAGDAMPPGNAALVKFLTGIGKVYARKFIGMFTEAAQANGILTAPYMAQLATYGAQVLSDIALTGGDLVAGVMSKKLAGFVETLTAEVVDVVSYQRRRRPGTGS